MVMPNALVALAIYVLQRFAAITKRFKKIH